jgi:integrase/recombinase XerD
MKKFRIYLEQLDLVPRTVNLQERQVKQWLKWLPVSVKDSNYKHLMNYVAHLQRQERPVHFINKSLQAISNYYEFKQLPNVAISTRIKGVITKTVLRPLTAEILDDIYQAFEVQKVNSKDSYFYHSDQLILGLMIYQGLEMGDFTVIELGDINLEKGTIYIPSRKHRLSRTIPLESHQILQFHQYIIQGREETKNKESEKLFSPQADDYHQLHWQLKRLSKHVKKEVKTKLDLQIEKLNHLRQSRIAIWIKQYGLRKAQYLSGFRTIMSVERYRNADLEDLKEQVKLHHPFK